MPKERFSGPPSYGLLGVLVFAWIVPLTYFLITLQTPSAGLIVHILKDLSAVKALPGNAPLIVRIDERHHYYLNSKQVPASGLQSAVQEALRHRFDKVVFVYADLDVAYGETLLAIDAVSGTHAQVVLITSRAKE